MTVLIKIDVKLKKQDFNLKINIPQTTNLWVLRFGLGAYSGSLTQFIPTYQT